MRFDNKYAFLILVTFLLLLIFTSSFVVVSSYCQPKCGNIEIPYPFGMKNENKDCYLNDDYKIDCLKNSTGGEYPILSKFNMTVVNIFVPKDEYGLSTSAIFGSVRVRIPITSRGCSNDGKETGSPLNLTGSPFFVENNNYLVAVGCKSKVSLTNIEPSEVICQLNCTAKTEFHSNNIPFFDKTGCSNNTLSRSGSSQVCTKDKTSCNGNGCCRTSITAQPQQVIGVRIDRTDENSMTKEECKVAFLTDDSYNLLNGTKPEPLFANGYSTLRLGWVIQTKNLSFLDSLSCKTQKEYQHYEIDIKRKISCVCDNITISENSYATCGCSSGYTGNAYILNGCAGQYMFLKLSFYVLVCVHIVILTR